MAQRWKQAPDGSRWGEFGPDDQRAAASPRCATAEAVFYNRFLLSAPPLRLPSAVGSPATPIATV